ncbi:YhgE/Pip domain-containing protein [Paenibacillus sp. 7523-1]|uniref:YhgE/Pip domain-containing protein n=1 Tax=Paenibacillus sp. 7523-1 TaxID=2022550 RepID=UPI0020D1C865|nr:ABC transporter permease [Paenibacillus sp. 7523-1]
MLKHKGVKAGIFMIVFYQIVMLTVFMSGYSAIPKNVTNLTVAIVNEDQQSGTEFVQKLQEQLPFHIVTDESLEQAKTGLEDRDIHMVIRIPGDFTEKLSEQSGKAQLEYLINESNPTTITSSMKSVAAEITAQISAQVQAQSFEAVLNGMQVPADQSKQIVESTTGKVSSNIVMSNPQPAGMQNQMAPMFITMALYVGAMIYAMQSVGGMQQFRAQMGKWKAFFALRGANLLISLIAPLVGVGIYFMVQGYGVEVFLKMWLVHSLQLFVSIEFTSIFIMLLGQGGMLINMIFVLSQSIANGTSMSLEMMPGYFKFVSQITPMFYSTHLDYNILFGGGRTAHYAIGLALVGLVAFVLNAAIHHFKHAKQTNPLQESSQQPAIV